MAITTGYGLKPVKLKGGQAYSGGSPREFPVNPTNVYAIGAGDLIAVVGGLAKAVGAAAPAAGTLSVNTPNGVAVGVRYVDPALKQQVYGQYLPATTTGYTNMFVSVVDDPDVIFQTRVDAALTSTSVGLNVNYVVPTAVNAATGVTNSYCTGAATTATFPFRIVEVLGGDGATYTDVLVCYNIGTHASELATGH